MIGLHRCPADDAPSHKPHAFSSDTLFAWCSSWRCFNGGVGGGKVKQGNCVGGNGNECGARVKYVSMHEPESPRTRDDSDIPKQSRKPQVVLPTVMCPQVGTGESSQCSAVLGQDEGKVEQESLLAQRNIRLILLINGLYSVRCGVHLFTGFTC